MITATNKMRQAYIMAALDLKRTIAHEPFVSRAYADEKVNIAFRSEAEEDLLGHLDLARRELYYKYYRELLQNGR